MGAELGKSAIEAGADRMGEEHHELFGRAKDLGSAMVFVAVTVTWSSVCLPIFYFTWQPVELAADLLCRRHEHCGRQAATR